MAKVNMEMAALELLQSREKEWDWIEQHIEELKEKYDQKLIAIKDKKVIAAASSLEAVIKMIEDLGEDSSLSSCQR